MKLHVGVHVISCLDGGLPFQVSESKVSESRVSESKGQRQLDSVKQDSPSDIWLALAGPGCSGGLCPRGLSPQGLTPGLSGQPGSDFSWATEPFMFQGGGD